MLKILKNECILGTLIIKYENKKLLNKKLIRPASFAYDSFISVADVSWSTHIATVKWGKMLSDSPFD